MFTVRDDIDIDARGGDMNTAGKIVMWLVISGAAALAGCTGDAVGADDEQEQAGPAREALVKCLPGYQYVSGVNACVSTPYTIDTTPGHFGCANGGIRSAYGRVYCFPVPYGAPHS